jgi:sigma-E factor negative regulatory protein RseA
MNPTLKEQLSALTDGELGPSEARFMLRSLDGDAELRRTWSRYHAIRAGLRRQDVGAADDFASRVMARIAEEQQPVVQRRWLRPIAGGLVAAGVAAAALFVSLPQQSVPDAPSAPIATIAETGVRGSDLAPRPDQLGLEVEPVAGRRPSVVVPAGATAVDVARLQGYLMRHGDATAVRARGSVAPYVYAVSAPPPPRRLPADAAR